VLHSLVLIHLLFPHLTPKLLSDQLLVGCAAVLRGLFLLPSALDWTQMLFWTMYVYSEHCQALSFLTFLADKKMLFWFLYLLADHFCTSDTRMSTSPSSWSRSRQRWRKNPSGCWWAIFLDHPH